MIKAQEANIHLQTEPNHNLPDRIYSDPLRLRQIVTNLLSNVIKFSKQDNGKKGMVELTRQADSPI